MLSPMNARARSRIRTFTASLLFLCVCPLPALPAPAADEPAPDATALVNSIVENFRKQILLHGDGAEKLDAARTQAGHYLFYQNRVAAAQLVSVAVGDAAACGKLIEAWQNGRDWMDVDRLSLGGVFTELDLKLAKDSPCFAAVKGAQHQVQAIRADYNREVTALLDDRRDTATGKRPKWTAYVQFLSKQYSVPQILAELGLDVAPKKSKARPSGTAQALARRGGNDEWSDGGLPDKTVLLTFDDGPHPIYTPRILDILARNHVHAVFFLIGQNLGTLDKDGNATIREPELVARMLREGHALANHTHTHPLLPRLDEVKLTDEIDVTEELLASAVPDGSRAKLFRPPYGARNDLVLAEIAARGLRSVIWNIDSRDWADPIPQSVAKRVLDEVAREGHGIVLFHDIHPRTVEAAAIVIDKLRAQGYRFARFENGALVVDETPALEAVAPAPAPAKTGKE